MAGNETVEVEAAESPLGIDEETLRILNAYAIFSNGDGLTVFEDLMAVFYFFESAEFNEELAEIPDPYREYVKAGCRKVMDKILLATKTAEQLR